MSPCITEGKIGRVGRWGGGGGGARVCYEMVMSFAKIILLNQSLCFSMNYFFSQNDTVSLSQCM